MRWELGEWGLLGRLEQDGEVGGWELFFFFCHGTEALTQRPGDAREVGVEAGSVWLKQEVLTGPEAGR